MNNGILLLPLFLDIEQDICIFVYHSKCNRKIHLINLINKTKTTVTKVLSNLKRVANNCHSYDIPRAERLIVKWKPGLEGIKLCSVLGAQKSGSKHEIQQFDWLIFESEYKNHARKFYDREAWDSLHQSNRNTTGTFEGSHLPRYGILMCQFYVILH